MHLCRKSPAHNAERLAISSARSREQGRTACLLVPFVGLLCTMGTSVQGPCALSPRHESSRGQRAQIYEMFRDSEGQSARSCGGIWSCECWSVKVLRRVLIGRPRVLKRKLAFAVIFPSDLLSAVQLL
jgi:hypothetical protein